MEQRIREWNYTREKLISNFDKLAIASMHDNNALDLVSGMNDEIEEWIADYVEMKIDVEGTHE